MKYSRLQWYHKMAKNIYILPLKIAYCQPVFESSSDECKKVCEEFVQTVYEHFPEYEKVKILHLMDNILDVGPISAFNTERYAIIISY